MDLDIKRKKRTLYDLSRIRWRVLTNTKAEELKERFVAMGTLIVCGQHATSR